jgi:hypothetical protein
MRPIMRSYGPASPNGRVPSLLCRASAGSRLQRHIECFWCIETFAPMLNRIAPDGCIDIVYSSKLGLRVVGAMTIQQNMLVPAGTKIIGARFRPGMGWSSFGNRPPLI